MPQETSQELQKRLQPFKQLPLKLFSIIQRIVPILNMKIIFQLLYIDLVKKNKIFSKSRAHHRF